MNIILFKSKRIVKIVLFTEYLADCVDFVMYCTYTSFSIQAGQSNKERFATESCLSGSFSRYKV